MKQCLFRVVLAGLLMAAHLSAMAAVTIVRTGVNYASLATAVSAPVLVDGDVVQVSDTNVRAENLTITKAITLECTAAGGKATLTNNGTAHVITCNQNSGGVITIKNFIIKNTSFRECVSTGAGNHNQTIRLENCELESARNIVASYRAEPSVTALNCTFANTPAGNSAIALDITGGSASASTPSVQVSNCRFTNCGRVTYMAGHAFALSVTDSTATACTNIAFSLTGTALAAGSAQLTRVSVSGGSSDVIQVNPGTKINSLQLDACTFTNNAGNVVQVKGPLDALTLAQCRLESNASGVNLLSTLAASPLVTVQRSTLINSPLKLAKSTTGSLVANNLFDQGSPAINLDDSAVTIRHNTIVNDRSGGDTAINFISDTAKAVAIENNIMDLVDSGITAGTTMTLSAVTVKNNLINPTTPTLALAPAILALPASAVSGNLLSVSARFATPSATAGAGTYRLTELSPAINAGLALGLTTDLRGLARPMPVGTAPDLGCYEQQYSTPVELSTFAAE